MRRNPVVEQAPGVETNFRQMMAGFPTGVAIVTTITPAGAPWGMTCTSLCSVSLEPATVLVCLRCGSPTLDAIRASGSFALNLLQDHAQSIAELFASGADDRFDRVSWRMDEEAGGPHLLESTHSVADCGVVDVHPVGDHSVVIGTVESAALLRRARPLLYGLRSYTSWPEPVGGAQRKAEAGRKDVAS